MLLSLLLCAAIVRPTVIPARPHIEHYDVRIVLDTAHKTFAGEVRIHMRSQAEPILLDAENLAVDSVLSDGLPLPFERDSTTLRAMPQSAIGEIRIVYHGRSSKGLSFADGEIFTRYHTNCWMPCDMQPSTRVPLSLSVEAPNGLAVTGSGKLISSESVNDTTSRYTWKEDRALPAYLYGFAIGKYNDRILASSHVVRIRTLTSGFDSSQLERAFKDADSMIAFFSEKSGMNYPAEEYTQVLTRADNEQEADRFSLISRDAATDMLADPREDWLVVHELSHQWWGNSVTCKTWSHFWLNEAFATFMTAAYKERAFGHDEYDREVFMARMRYARLFGTPKDRPIVRDDWKDASEMGGTITYYKGMLVLNYLRAMVGEKAFWQAIKSYTKKHWHGSVTTDDLRESLEQASHRDLRAFFEYWVYSVKHPRLEASFDSTKSGITIVVRQLGDSFTNLDIPVAVMTSKGLKTAMLRMTTSIGQITLPADSNVLSVRVDDGGALPVRVQFRRPLNMLLYQAAHEPDAAGRVDAMRQLADDGELSAAREVLLNAEKQDAARVVRQVAHQLLAKLSK